MRALLRRFVRGAAVRTLPAALLLAASGCRSDRIVVPPDTTAPRFQILSPVDTLYDLDGDRLVDVSLAWQDPGGAVNPASIRVRTLRPLNGSADTATNLLSVWRVARADTGGLLLRETLANLLPDGLNRLEVSVKDTAGNRQVDTLVFTLPPGAFYTTIETGVTSSADHAIGIVVDSAGRRGYMAASQSLVVFDAESLRLVTTIPSGGASFLRDIVLDEPRGHAYVSDGRIERYDLRTNTLIGRVPGTFATGALAFSRTTPSLLYAGEAFAGALGYVDIVADARIDGMLIPHTFEEFVNDLAVLPGDTKLYMTRYDQGGILVIDPVNKQILRHLEYINGARFYTDDFVLSRDDRHLYIALLDADPRGIADLDTQTDSVVRFLPLFPYVPGALGLSPSQRRLFVTTGEQFLDFPARNVLVDVERWAVIQEFDRPHPPGTIRVDGQVAFRPDGKLIFVSRDLVVDVYLNREVP
jgi:DNA-binding beta-propeller fold protein YncE